MSNDESSALLAALIRIAGALEEQNRLSTELLTITKRQRRTTSGMTGREVQAEIRRDVEQKELIEQLANKVHASWAHWMIYLFFKCDETHEGDYVIPCELVERWKRQVTTPYTELSEQEKQPDRDEVAHILPIIQQFTRGAER